ncbi:MAG TPA: peptidoglycan bridge formation glycyltransferase FemA/FemB family protein [Ktedonobacterales bacterium]|nr:peptidoglycan bridge formation glycyltransferase FemA/FemB family protein [Ktedonobacterales bacterium]
MEVREITDRAQWDDFVSQAQTGHLMQSYQWGELMKQDGRRILRVGVLEEGQLVAAALVQFATMPYLGAPWLYVPRGPVVDDPASPALPAIIDELHRIARRERAAMLKIEPHVEEGAPGWREALKKLGFQPNPIPTHVRRSWLLDISPPEQKLLAGMKRSWRYNIKVAERGDIQVRLASTPEDMQAFYRIYQQTSQRDDFTILPLKHYTDILDLFGDDARLFLAEYQGETLVGHLLIRYGAWCWDMFGATAEAHRNLKPGYLLHWKTFLWAKEQGCSMYDFRGVPEVLEPGEEMWNVYEYKRGFGGFSRLSLATHDYIYRPLLYWPVTLASRARVNWRRRQRRRWELQRTRRGESGKAEGTRGEEKEKEAAESLEEPTKQH